jgi:hypothetical protein
MDLTDNLASLERRMEQLKAEAERLTAELNELGEKNVKPRVTSSGLFAGSEVEREMPAPQHPAA